MRWDCLLATPRLRHAADPPNATNAMPIDHQRRALILSAAAGAALAALPVGDAGADALGPDTTAELLADLQG